MQSSIWKAKKNELVLAVRTLRQLNFSSELMKLMYNKKQEQQNQIKYTAKFAIAYADNLFEEISDMFNEAQR